MKRSTHQIIEVMYNIIMGKIYEGKVPASVIAKERRTKLCLKERVPRQEK